MCGWISGLRFTVPGGGSVHCGMGHLVQIACFFCCFENRSSWSDGWILVVLSRILICCKNCQILIHSPLKVKSLNLLSKFRGCILMVLEKNRFENCQKKMVMK